MDNANESTSPPVAEESGEPPADSGKRRSRNEHAWCGTMRQPATMGVFQYLISRLFRR
jgi:hypothetical protein